MNESIKRPITMSKGQLAQAYGVHLSTFNKWISVIPDLRLQKGQRVLTPKQLALIYDHLGAPDSYDQSQINSG